MQHYNECTGACGVCDGDCWIRKIPVNMDKIFKVADIHLLLKMVSKDEISYGRMVELMNEKVTESLKDSQWLFLLSATLNNAARLIKDEKWHTEYKLLIN
jgi:site-specific recombinase